MGALITIALAICVSMHNLSDAILKKKLPIGLLSLFQCLPFSSELCIQTAILCASSTTEAEVVRRRKLQAILRKCHAICNSYSQGCIQDFVQGGSKQRFSNFRGGEVCFEGGHNVLLMPRVDQDKSVELHRTAFR